MAAFEKVVAATEAKTGRAGRNGSWCCPAHDDSTPSLSITTADGKVIIHCHAGCTVQDVVAAVGLRMTDLFDPSETNGHVNGKARITAAYNYTDAAGALLFQVVRMDPKTFRQRRPDGRGGWEWKLGDTPRVLYQLPRVVDALAEKTVFVAEGEKDCDAIIAAGEVATCNPGGAGKWRPEHTAALAGAFEIVIVVDDDEPGYQHAAAVYDALDGTVGNLLLARAKTGKDAADHLGAGHGIDDMVFLTRQELDALFSPPAARAIVQSPPPLAAEQDILGRFVRVLHDCGVVGEDRNARTVYLGLTSRVLDEPVSLAVKGLSSSGKSHTVETTLKFFPEAAYIPMTAMSEKALIYMKEDFAHRTLVLFEAVALKEQREKTEGNQTAYFVRSLLSEGRINYPVTVRDKDGNFITKTIVKNGPTNMILTTTAVSLHGENETRMLSLPTNDSAEQTKAVLKQLAMPARAVDLEEWRQLQLWIEQAEHRVLIPFAPYLAESIPPVAVRLRRDFKSVLRLVEAHAILHQANRERDNEQRIVADWADYLAVRKLVADLLADGVGATVPETVRDVVDCVQALAKPEGVRANQVARALKLDPSAAYRRLQHARQRGYIENLEDKPRRPGRYIIGDPLPDEIELLPEVPPDDCTIADTDREESGQPA
jgi:hypothetical protein